MRTRHVQLLTGLMILGLGAAPACPAATVHVAKTGDDAAGDGSAGTPFLTIQRAAETAMPGDTVLVHAGVYRERVTPPRGGSAGMPITYRAADGETVRLCGSEEIDTWQAGDDGVHSVILPAGWFGERNPFATPVAGPYMTYGKWHSLGQVYLDNRAFIEVKDAAAVAATAHTWHATVADDGSTHIVANFGDVEPNAALAEINRRAMVFAPAQAGCNHIVIDGFTIAQAANAWAAPNRTQEGAIWPHMATGWVIRDCLVEHARCVGISIGRDPDWPPLTRDNIGHHRIERCVIRHCGEAGIVGNRASSFSRIEGCLIEDINTSEEFGGWETAGIKVHLAVDPVIRGNCLRRIHWGDKAEEGFCRESGFGIWIDYACQNVRITGNVILDTEGECIDLEKNSGPILIDNNIFFDRGALIVNGNEATVWAHNLFLGGSLQWYKNDDRELWAWIPHSLDKREGTNGRPADTHHKVFNNVFVGAANKIPDREGNAADHNLYLAGAKASRYDANGIVADANVDPEPVSDGAGVTLALTVPEAWATLRGPLLTHDFLGVFPTPQQGLVHPDGTPVLIDQDFSAAAHDRSGPRVGPFADLAAGRVTRQLFTTAAFRSPVSHRLQSGSPPTGP
jgi:alpha-N-arabinofuranosidase